MERSRATGFTPSTSPPRSGPRSCNSPIPLRVNLPPHLQPSRLLIACVIDQNGSLRHWHVLQSDSSDFSAKILAALPGWKFTPAFRGNEAVEVNAILGFGSETK